MKTDKYKDVKRPTVTLSQEEHKLIAHYCIDLDLNIGDFIRQSAIYCVKHKINPEKKG